MFSRCERFFSCSRLETREGLNRQALRQERRQKMRHEGVSATGLLPQSDSARAYYLLLLQTVAQVSAELAHRPYETPLEYERRLCSRVEILRQEQGQEQPPGTVVLHELTEGYMDERYGQQSLDSQRQAFLRRWFPHLLSLFHAK